MTRLDDAASRWINKDWRDMSEHIIERTTVRLPRDLLERARRKATADGVTLTALIEDGLRKVVTEKAEKAPQKRILPRISKATGGLRSGIDLSNSAAIQEIEDLEYMERMKTLR